jgi:hypothetical protein
MSSTPVDPDQVPWTLPSFLDALDQRHLSYTLGRFRDSVCVTVAIPGEHWEVEFMDEGGIEIERYIGSGEIADQRVLDELLALDDE